MKKFKLLSLMALLAVAVLSFTACSDDDDSPVDAATLVSGNYAGTVKPIGYTDEPAPAYATLERRAADAVTFELVCETFGQDMDPVFLTCKEQADGTIQLTSESTRSIYGTYKSGTISLTYGTGNGTSGSVTWVFTGSKS